MKLGLVLEGGASRTIFSCGILDALLEQNIMADYVIGTSAGISYGVSYCSGQMGRNLTITEKYMADKRYMGVKHLLDPKNKSYYNLDFVFGEIPQKLVPFDVKAFTEYKGSCIAVLTDIESGRAEYMELPREDMDFMGLRASCALPILFRPVEINGRKYMDGGLTDSIPFEKAIADGCDKVIVILTRPRGYVKKQEKTEPLIKAMYRKYPKLVENFENRPEAYNRSVKRLSELEKEGRAFVIAPPDTHNIHRTERRPEILVPYYKEGAAYGRKIMPQILEYLKATS